MNYGKCRLRQILHEQHELVSFLGTLYLWSARVSHSLSLSLSATARPSTPRNHCLVENASSDEAVPRHQRREKDAC